MLEKLKGQIRLLFDSTMFKFNQEFIKSISAKPCNKCFGNTYNNDLIILFDDKCQHCTNIDNHDCEFKYKNIKFNTIAIKISESMKHIKNLGFNYNIIFAFYVNPTKYNNYTDYYKEFLLKFPNLFSADYIILYGLKRHKIKVIKCIDNISIGLKSNPIFTNQHNCTITEVK